MTERMLTTDEVVALRGLGREVDSRWVDWAVGMLDPGYDRPALCELAGAVGPYNYFEMAALLDRVLVELGIRPYASREEAAVGYASVLCQQVVDGEGSVDAVLAELQRLCTELDYLDAIYDFYLLFFAQVQLKDSDHQAYWPGATRENIDEIAAAYCRDWTVAHPIDRTARPA